MKSNFIKRAVTGVLFVIVLAGSILWSPFSFAALFLIISILTVHEFNHIVCKAQEGVHINQVISLTATAYLFLAVLGIRTHAGGMELLFIYPLLILYTLISELYLKKEKPVLNWAFSLMGQLYIALPFALLTTLPFQYDKINATVMYYPIVPMSIFVFLWMSDTGAYCIGSLIGKHRLFERISPKKSWEGSIGGALVAIAAALGFAYAIPIMSYPEWVGLALVVVVFGTWGDLTESLLKRQFGLKDSGNILPGHGGMLDRFDSALMAIPASVAYIYLLAFIK